MGRSARRRADAAVEQHAGQDRRDRRRDEGDEEHETDWQELLCQWARNELVSGKQDILRDAVPAFEHALIEVALAHTRGRKREAAELLGWGRNTLTRKMKELDMSD